MREIEKAYKILMEIQSDREYGEEYEAFNLALEALEKQIPKKVIRERAVSQECPVCGFIINGEYCNKCGQRLDRDW